MEAISKYTNDLLRAANEYLRVQYKNIDSLKFNGFQTIEFFLIDRAVNNKMNIFIGNNDKELTKQSQFPSLLSVAISLFFKNYCDDGTVFKLNDIVQKNNIKYRIVEMFEEDGLTCYRLHCKITKYSNRIKRGKEIYEFQKLTSEELSDRKSRLKFDEYKKLYKLLFDVDTCPSAFKYKAAIIIDKRNFDEELRKQKYIDLDILKAIPIRWISKNGTETWNYLPVEPMIYCLPDFETFEQFILEKNQKIETLILIGNNKYSGDALTKIKRNLRECKIPNCIILGSEAIYEANSPFFSWKWTFEEYAYLEGKQISDISQIILNDDTFESNIQAYLDLLKNLEEMYSIRLGNVKSLRKFLYPLALSKEADSRNNNQVEYVKHLILKVGTESIIENLYNQNIEPIQHLSMFEKAVNRIFESFSNEKYKKLKTIYDFDIIIVPEQLLANWKEEYRTKAEILSLKEFFKIKNLNTATKKILILSLFSNGLEPCEIIKLFENTPHKISILSYKEEADILVDLKNKYFNDKIEEYTSKDREAISGIRYEMKKKETSVSDLIENISLKSQNESKDYFYDETEQVNYRIDFVENEEYFICEGSKNVLLFLGDSWIKSKVANLRGGDKVRIYNNLSKDNLFSLATDEDKQGRFNKVEADSKIWKMSLMEYFERKVSANLIYTECELLKDLQNNGLTILNINTIKKWLSKEDKEKFPSSAKNLFAIKVTVKDSLLDAHFEEIKMSRRFYRGVMISLGRDLSDDVMEYIISSGNTIGKMLSKLSDQEIQSFVDKAAPIRTIKNKKYTEEDESNGIY